MISDLKNQPSFLPSTQQLSLLQNSHTPPKESSKQEELLTKDEPSDENEKKEPSKEKLTSADKSQIANLVARDSKVRAHEAAHIAAGGGVIKSGAQFSYQEGPDGKLYATGGEVSIDISSGSTHQETISKMQQVRTAALAPSDPSPQDLKVASTASLLEMKARILHEQEILQEEAKQEKGLQTYQEEAVAA
jgi:hypothetical protein